MDYDNTDFLPRTWRLGTQNYLEWALRMEAKLIRRGVWSVVKPVAPEENSKQSHEQEKLDLARALLIEGVEKSQLVYLQEEADPRKIWAQLKKVHRSRGLATRMSLKRRMFLTSKGEGQSIQDYISTILGIQWELKDLGIPLGDDEVILALTTGLGNAYETLVVALDSTPEKELTLELVIQRLLNEETRQNIGTEEYSSAYAVSSRNCWECGEAGHTKANCPKRKKVEPNAAVVAKKSCQIYADMEDRSFTDSDSDCL